MLKENNLDRIRLQEVVILYSYTRYLLTHSRLRFFHQILMWTSTTLEKL